MGCGLSADIELMLIPTLSLLLNWLKCESPDISLGDSLMLYHMHVYINQV